MPRLLPAPRLSLATPAAATRALGSLFGPGCRGAWPLLCLALAGLAGPPAAAAEPPPTEGRIYSCVDANGKRFSSDRPVPECMTKEQRLLNRDGSMRSVVPPARSAEDMMREEAVQRQRAQESAAKDESIRRDRMLLVRYPNDKSHETARQRQLEPTLKLIDSAKSRLAKLEAESDQLTTARAALGFKPVPDELKARVGANEAALEAQRNILRKEETARDRLNSQFDTERARLQQLWAGAAPGSEAASAPSPAATRNAPSAAGGTPR